MKHIKLFENFLFENTNKNGILQSLKSLLEMPEKDIKQLNQEDFEKVAPGEQFEWDDTHYTEFKQDVKFAIKNIDEFYDGLVFNKQNFTIPNELITAVVSYANNGDPMMLFNDI